MSLWEADAKFPGQKGDGLAPEKTPENPGQVYPKSSPFPAPKAKHWDRPTPPGPDDPPPESDKPPLARPMRTTDAVPGNGRPTGGDDPRNFASQDRREEQQNPSVDSEKGKLYAD
ncbi:hypothetical protein CALCODRAFT_516088 [Calocera cornea HHB12733]|uniref:Uncharacterized protein n=1 Tax=Calocera cornea HHB12733 TaxID=1353952 RepID=A0A165HML0_9BASI|nr:hypothetical protein CALCODRAFT_516088 [Calocera cornea HHB12733]